MSRLRRILSAVRDWFIKIFRMKRGIHLYIDGEELDLSGNSTVLFNYAVKDLQNPTVVRNTFSKKITVPGTPKNNRIFGSIWNLEGGTYNAGRKAPFTVFVDDEVYETGYAKLDGISRKWNTTTYEVSLYGGLGDFFYSLSQKEDITGVANKKTLADLVFRYEEPDSEEVDLDFVINQDTVKEAWDYIDAWSTKWRFINFAPAYNGLPSDFDSDKVAVFGLHADEHQQDGKTYRPYENWTIDVLPREYTGSEMREFRSYLQRPVIRAMEVIKACALPENNGGYSVNLDPAFFNGNNPYWQDAWVTLPMLSSVEYVGTTPGPEGSITFTGSVTGTTTQDDVDKYWDDKTIAVSGVTSDSNYSLKVVTKFTMDITGVTASELYITANQSSPYLAQRDRMGYNGAVVVQLVAYDSFGNAVAGSTPIWLRSPYWGYDQYTEPVSLFNQGYEGFAYPSDELDVCNGYFVRSGSTYVWNSKLTLHLDNIPPGATLKLVTHKIAAYWFGRDFRGGDPVMHVWSVDRNGHTEHGNQAYYYDWRWTWHDMDSFGFDVQSVDINLNTPEAIRSGALIEKRKLLATDYSPADFLLSYTKLFGLYFRKDPARKTIDILTRGNFYNGGIEDISDKLDRDDVQITPVTFDKKWYRFGLDESASEYGDDYRKVYGEQYGDALINTGYEFNNDTEEVFKDNIFKSSVEVLERSDAFAVVPDSERELIYTYKGYSYLLYNINDPQDSYEVEVPMSSTVDLLTGLENAVYYDLFPKVQLHTADNSPADGDCVLLFHDGNVSLVKGAKSLGYRITDDNGWMNYLNDNRPCWLISNSDYDTNDYHIMTSVETCPKFGRYIIYGPSGYITKSMDFGEPKTLYIPNATSTPDGTLYNECWKDFIGDLYNPNTRVVEANVKFDGRVTVDTLRKFYWFDGQYWAINKITDWDMLGRGLTKVEFVKVNDPENYDTIPIKNDPKFDITLSAYEVPLEGGTVSFTAITSDNGSWYTNYDWDYITVTPDHASASTTGTITIAPYTGTTDRECQIQFVADPTRVLITIMQRTIHGSISLTGPSTIPATGGTTTFRVEADGPWSIVNAYSGIITAVTPSSGVATEGTTVTAYFGDNSNGSSYRDAYLQLRLGNSLVRSTGVRQEAPYSISLSHYQRDFDSLGGTNYVWDNHSGGDFMAVIYPLSTDWATVNYVNNSDSTGTSTIVVQPNSTGQQRSCTIFYYPVATGVQGTPFGQCVVKQQG